MLDGLGENLSTIKMIVMQIEIMKDKYKKIKGEGWTIYEKRQNITKAYSCILKIYLKI